MPKTRSRLSPPAIALLSPAAVALRWLPIGTAGGVLAGLASALLLVSLDLATHVREAHPSLIALLPFAGLAMGSVYHRYGRSVERGNNLILEQIHRPSETLPLRMTPLILIGTFVTHLFGGSAGREGTAIQTGASLADQLTHPLRLGPAARRLLLMSGISAGFASVFGVPLAGTVFGMEVLALGTVTYDAIGPCLIAALVGDLVTRRLYLHHAHYLVSAVPLPDLRRLLLAALAGAAFGVAARAFLWLTRRITRLFSERVVYAPLRPFLGGILVGTTLLATGALQFAGLGTATIAAAFEISLPWYTAAAKAVLTALTLGSGFKGGEVTPLFFIGSTLGNALAHLLPLPPSLLAAMGLAAVFSGAANTPVAATLMAFELFGSPAGIYCCIACIVSYLCSGTTGLYNGHGHSQLRKPPAGTPQPTTQLTEI